MQSGEILPLSEVLNNQDEVNQIDVLRQHIGQLIIEIAQAISDEPLVEKSEEQLGFYLIKSFSENKSTQTLIDLLQALLGQSQAIDDEVLYRLLSLLTGLQSDRTAVIRLEDMNFIKLMRVFRLIRQYVELTQ